MNNKSTIGIMTTEKINYLHLQSGKYIDDSIVEEKEGIIVFLDVLGWKNIFTNEKINDLVYITNKLRSWILDNALRSAESVAEVKYNVDVINLSDSILIAIETFGSYNPLNIFTALSEFITNGLEVGLMFRGAISFGKYSINKSKNIFGGEAIFDAAKYYESTNWAGVVITDKGLNFFKKYNDWEENLFRFNIISYNNVPFKNKEISKSLLSSYILLPENRVSIKFLDDKPEKHCFDFESKYKELMNSDNDDIKEKLKNTLEFFMHVRKDVLPKDFDKQIEILRKNN